MSHEKGLCKKLTNVDRNVIIKKMAEKSLQKI